MTQPGLPVAMLRQLNGLHPGREHLLEKERVVLGRHPECDVVLDAAAVSRQHTLVLRIADEYLVEDLRSRNGTYVNNQLIEGRRRLANQDQVKICDQVFLFQAPPGSDIIEVMYDEDDMGSSIKSKLDLSTSLSGLRVTVNPEAKLRALLDIMQNLVTTLELGDLLPKILDNLFKIFVQADQGFVALAEGPGGKLVPRAIKHRRPGASPTIHLSQAVVEVVMQGKQAVLSTDAAADSRFNASESVMQMGIRSMMCAPLIDSKGRALGMLQVDTLDQRAHFQQGDLDLLATVAAQAALAVEIVNMHRAAVRQEVIERDLALARRVQQGLLPAGAPQIQGYDFYDFYQPADQVGGDYYDYVPLPNHRLAVIVADVAGKGVAAALLMAKISAEARYSLATHRDPAVAVSQLNENFIREGLDDRFVTMVLVVLDPAAHAAEVVNAGHMPPYLRHAGGQVEAVGDRERGRPLGIEADSQYEATRIALAPGDWLVMFTDGISEAMNPAGKIFSLPKVQASVCAAAGSVTELGRQLLADVERFAGNQPRGDDVCLVCFGRVP